MFKFIKTKAGSNYLTAEEEKQFFKYIKRLKDRQAERDFALLKTCRLLALRRGEALSLNVGDIKDKKILIVDERIAEKGAVGELDICPELENIFKRFLYFKRQWGESLDLDSPLFISKKKVRLTNRAFNHLMDKWCSESGIPRYTPHALRHTKAHRIFEKIHTLPPEKRANALIYAQKQLRHKSISSTTAYLLPNKEDRKLVAAF